MDKYIIAIETSSSICGVSILYGQKILGIEEKDVSRKHAELLPGMTKAALNKANKILDDIDAIAISIGPGSFTGLRVGLGFAKGLAYSKNLPIIPVSSMLSLAFSLRKHEPKQGILHSHGNKIFFQTFGWVDNIPFSKGQPSLFNINDCAQSLRYGFHYKCENILPDEKRVKIASHSSSNIGILAGIYFNDFIVRKPHGLVPEYIAPFITSN